MLGELAHGTHVHLLGALRHAGKLQVFDHAALQCAGWPNPAMAGPLPLEGFFVEELNTVARRAACPFGVGFEILEILAQFFIGNCVWWLVVMPGQLTHGVHVKPLLALRHAATLHVCDHAAAQFGGGTEFIVGKHDSASFE